MATFVLPNERDSPHPLAEIPLLRFLQESPTWLQLRSVPPLTQRPRPPHYLPPPRPHCAADWCPNSCHSPATWARLKSIPTPSASPPTPSSRCFRSSS